MTKAPSNHMANLISKLSDAELARKIESFQRSTDFQMLSWLKAERNQRHGR